MYENENLTKILNKFSFLNGGKRLPLLFVSFQNNRFFYIFDIFYAHLQGKNREGKGQ